MSGERLDTQAILQEVFQSKTLSASESVLEYARQRQGIVIAVSLAVAFLILAGLHQFVTMRNATAVTDSPAVPLTEITDVAKLRGEVAPAQMPALDFPYEGRPLAMRMFIVEPGAVAPAPVAVAPAGAAGAGGLKPTVPPLPAPQARTPQAAPPPPR
jgi:hypothetical protein